jgi:hypothetical protein
MSDRKKSVSFCDPLEEVRYIDSCKDKRNKSSDVLVLKKSRFDPVAL